MSKLIGVSDAPALGRLKRWLLLVDQIAVVDLFKEDWSFRSEKPSLAADLDWLRHRGIVFPVNNYSKLNVNVEKIVHRDGRIILVPGPRRASLNVRTNPPADAKPMTVAQLLDALSDALCRRECQNLRGSADVDAISLRVRSPHLLVCGEERKALGDVHHVTIKAMPEPDETTPLESILEFRDDSVAKGKLLALRRWMAGMTKANVSPRELADEIEWLLHEYESYMKVHEMKVRRGVLETVITGAAQMAEDFVKIKWGKLAKMPFAISARKIELLEAELKAPGREISYIAHVRSDLRK